MASTKHRRTAPQGSDVYASVVLVNELSTAVAELVTDSGTDRTFMTETETLIEELHDDHATFKTAADQTETLVEELHDDHATFKTVVDDLKTLVNNLRRALGYGVHGNPTLAIDTNFDVKSTEPIYYTNGGTIKTLADNFNFDTGTSKTITGSNWGAFVCSVNSSGTMVVTWASGGGYASEAAAIAALTDPGATDTIIGYVTVQAHASGFTAGTDALTGGAGGNVATTTNYYNSINPNSLLYGAAVSSSSPATLTAPKPASAPATLTAPKPASPAAAITATGTGGDQVLNPAGTAFA